MIFHVLPEYGRPIVSDTAQRVTQLDLETDENKERMKDFNNKTKRRFKYDSLLSDDDKSTMHDWGTCLQMKKIL